MNSRERVKTSLEHKIPDVVPAGPFLGYYASEYAKIKLIDYITDGKNIAKAQYSLWEELGQDIVVTAADTYYITEGFGMELNYSENELPTVKKSPIESLEQVNQLKVPNPYRDGRMHVYLEAADVLRGKVGNNAAIRGTGTGPFSIAAYLIGPQDFLLKLAEIELEIAEEWEVRAMKDLLEICSQATIEFLKAQIEVGVDIIYIGDSLASCNMISPEMYRKYAFPYHKMIFESIENMLKKHGAHSMVHICGDNTQILTDIANTGTNLIEIDSKMDLALCKEMVGDRVSLIGNLNPTDVMLQGTSELVELESQFCIEKAAAGGGFILGTGCFVPFKTPIVNLHSMVKTAHRFKY